MPDVFATWVTALANLKSAGIIRVLVQATGEDAYYDLGIQREGVIHIDMLSKEDTYLAPYSWGFYTDTKVQGLAASKAVIQALDKLITKHPLKIAIQFTDGLWLISEAGELGLRWKLHAGGDFDDFRYVEYEITGGVQASELAGLLTASAPTLGTEDVGDVLYAFRQTTINLPLTQPNGFKKIEMKAVGDAAYVDIGDFREGKYIFECIGVSGGGGHRLPRTNAIKLTLDAILHETDLTKLELLPSIRNNAVLIKVTHMDDTILTLPSPNFNSVINIRNDGNADKMRELHLMTRGVMPDISGTKWSDLWT